MNTIQGRDITPVLDNAQDFTSEIFSESLWAIMVVLYSFWATRTLLFKGWAIKISKINSFFAIYSPEQPHRNYHNYRMTNQGIPKDEQPLCYLFSWATSSVLTFIVSNQSTAFQRMSNHYVYYSLWATYYFFISSSLANEMCQRGPGDAGRILPTVLSYLIRYYLT